MPASTSQFPASKGQPWKDVVKPTDASGTEYITLSGPVASQEESGTLSGQKFDFSGPIVQREESGTLSG